MGKLIHIPWPTMMRWPQGSISKAISVQSTAISITLEGDTEDFQIMRHLSLSLVLAFSLVSFSGYAEDATSLEAEVVRMINDSSSLSDRCRGFWRAKEIDSSQINRKLVELLESELMAKRSGDVVLMPSWYESLAILAKRFPEARISLPLAYDRVHAEAFKRWWIENEARIEYHDNGHSLRSGALPENPPKRIVP